MNLASLKEFQQQLATPEIRRRLLAMFGILGFLALSPEIAMAQSTFDLPIVNVVGCAIIRWLSGPLAIVIFLIVVVATFVVGIFAKMDWSKILTVVVLYGILQGIISGAFNLGIINPPAGCLQ